MDPRLQIRIQRYGWDAAQPYYEAGWQDSLQAAQDTLMDMAGLEPGERVVETACGSGLVTARIAAAVGPKGNVVATDLSQKMVEATAALGLDNVEALRMGAEELDLPDATFDQAICALGLMYVPDPVRALTAFHRVLKPGGQATATVWGARRNCGWAEIFPIVDARVRSEVCPMFFATGAPGALVRDFETAGFTEVREQRQSETLCYDTPEALLSAVIMGGPVAMAISRFDDATMAEVNEEFLRSVADFRMADGSYGIPGEFVTVTGRRPLD